MPLYKCNIEFLFIQHKDQGWILIPKIQNVSVKTNIQPCKSQTFYPHSFGRLGQIFHQFYLVDKTSLVSNMTQKSFSKKVIMFNHGKITSKIEILINQLYFFRLFKKNKRSCNKCVKTNSCLRVNSLCMHIESNSEGFLNVTCMDEKFDIGRSNY